MSDPAKNIRRAAEEATAGAMRDLQNSHELRRLYGTPLHIDDDPDWLVTRVLKQQGFSHPLIELGRELDAPREAAERVIARLRRRRAFLADPESRSSATQTYAFNQSRLQSLEAYREKLQALNRAIRDYNLQAPDALQQRPVIVEDALSRVAEEVPPLEPPPLSEPARRKRALLRWWRARE